jgi:uncharacterized membrane protein
MSKNWFYEMFWVFIFAGVIGVLVENVYVLSLAGHLENRSGLLYGPFNQVYAFGGMFTVILVNSLGVSRRRFLIPLAALVGGTVEYVSSYLLEKTYGILIWDYTGLSMSIQGRTNLVYCLAWGIIGMAFYKYVYPQVGRFIARIDGKLGIALTWMVLVLLVGDMALSKAAMARLVERHAGIPARSSVDLILDKYYDDSFYKRNFRNIEYSD